METSARSMTLLLIIEVIIIILSIIFLRYDKNASASLHERDRIKNVIKKHSIFEDVHVMIFVGFGFLMTFLKKYGFSAVGFSFLLTAVIVQWSIFCHGVFHISSSDYKIHVDLDNLINADIASAAVLISMGAVLGRTTPIQLILMGLIESILFSVNEYIQRHLKVTDVGGSMVVHVFGAYFGLAVSRILGPPKGDNLPESSSSTSDMFAMIGTMFLWVFWPSFNGVLATDDEQHRAVINTYLSLVACVVTAYAMSAILSEHKKFDMVHIQNSTLAGGVAIGTSADLMVQPYGALIVGFVAGIISVAGYVYLTPFLLKKFQIHDTCGVHNLHGMPGVLAGVVGALLSWLATQSEYGFSLYLQFPGRAPLKNTDELIAVQKEINTIQAGDDRTAIEQAGFQLLVLLITLLISTVGGTVTGLIIRSKLVTPIPDGGAFQDELHWEVPEIEHAHKHNRDTKIEEAKC